MIKKIHQFSKSGNLQNFELESQKRLIELNPDYEYKLWTTDGEELKNIFYNKYPEIYNIWDKIKGIQRADIGRYLVLYLEGGFYCDTDFYINESLDNLGELNETYFSPSTPDFIFFEPGFTNYFIYSPGNDSFFLNVIKESLKRIKETKDYNQPSYISYTTGKILLNKLVKIYNYKVNIFSEKKIVNKYCNFTETKGSFAYHDGGTSRTNKTKTWVNPYVTRIMDIECSLRKNLGVKGNLCQIPLLFIIAVILTLVLIFYSFRKINRLKRVNKEKKVRFKK